MPDDPRHFLAVRCLATAFGLHINLLAGRSPCASACDRLLSLI
jgi:hypothetical protein